MSSVLDQLLEMGFSKELAEKATNSTGNSGLNAAMDWLIEHQCDNEAIDTQTNGTDKGQTISNSGEPMTDQPTQRKSFKCDECDKLLRNDEEVQLHSARMGHVSYSESTEEIKPLTEEERKIQMEKLQELLQQKKSERETKEKEDETEREKQRRRQGKDIVSAKAKFEEDEMKRLVEQRRREKIEDQEYREKLKAQIAQEREEKRKRDLGENPEPDPAPKPALPPQTTKSDSAICRIQIRFSTGPPIKCDFLPTEPLSSVRLHVSQLWPDSQCGLDPTKVGLFTTFPKRDFTEDQMQTSLSELGLCPSAVLMARRVD